MTEIASKTRDCEGLCHRIQLPTGQVLVRDQVRPSLWHDDSRDGPALLRDRLHRLGDTAGVERSSRAGRSVRDQAADLAEAVRSEHGMRFLWTFALHGDGVVIHDEIDDPDCGRYRFRLEGGSHIPTTATGFDGTLARWFATGPNPADLKRTYAAAAYIVHLLNLELGARTNTAFADPALLDAVPRRPWRSLETADQIFISDAYDVEIMSLRTPACHAQSPVSTDASRTADSLIRLVNADALQR